MKAPTRALFSLCSLFALTASAQAGGKTWNMDVACKATARSGNRLEVRGVLRAETDGAKGGIAGGELSVTLTHPGECAEDMEFTGEYPVLEVRDRNDAVIETRHLFPALAVEGEYFWKTEGGRVRLSTRFLPADPYLRPFMTDLSLEGDGREISEINYQGVVYRGSCSIAQQL